MQRKHRVFSMLVLILTVCAIFAAATAGANPGSGDLDGDGKLSVHDAQLLLESQNGIRELTAQQSEAAGNLYLSEIIDRVRNTSTDGLIDADGNGYIEIRTVHGLYNMSRYPDRKYELIKTVKDAVTGLYVIDMHGLHWTPVIFGGELKGNGVMISNVQIVEGVTTHPSRESTDQGFFAEIKEGAKVENLVLYHVNITAAEDAQFIGILAGSNRGAVSGVYCVGSVTDQRTDVTHTGAWGAGTQTMIGAALGRNLTTGTYTPPSSGYAEVPAKFRDAPYTEAAYSGMDTPPTYRTAAELALYLAEGRSDVVTGLLASDGAKLGITAQYQDTTGIYELPQNIKDRQQTVVDYMWEMGTYKWITPEKISYWRNTENTPYVYAKEQTRYGLYYNQNSGSLERGKYAIENWSKLDDGKYDTTAGVTNWRNSEAVDNPEGFDGWVRYMGNDCSSSVAWAWWRISPVDIRDNHGGVRISETYSLVPTDDAYTNYGVMRVGEYTMPNYIQGTSDTADIWNANKENNYEAMYNAFAQARKGDILMCWITDPATDAGHCRLIAYDPVVIRNADGTIDPAKSYFIVHEHGGRVQSRATNTWYKDLSNGQASSQWGLNQLYYFSDLDISGINTTPAAGDTDRAYVPVTCRALRAETVREPLLNDDIEGHPVSTPFSGYLWSSYRIISAEVTIKKDGQTVASDIGFASAGANNSQTRRTIAELRRGDLYTEVATPYHDWGARMNMHEYFDHLAAKLTVDETYTFTVDVTLSNGKTYPLEFTPGVTEQTFTYEP